jgi:hypothetical protein
MVQKGKRKSKKGDKRDVEEYPEPPKEHAYELKMEKRLKRMLAEAEEQEAKKKPS